MNLRKISSLLLSSLILFSSISVGAIKDIHPSPSSASLRGERCVRRRKKSIVARYNKILHRIYTNKDDPEELDQIHGKLRERQRAGTITPESNYLSLVLFVCIMYSNAAKIFSGIIPVYKACEDASEMITMIIMYPLDILSVLNHTDSELVSRTKEMLTELRGRLIDFNRRLQQ